MRANSAQVIRIRSEFLVYEPIIARNIDAAVTLVRRIEFVIVQDRMELFGHHEGDTLPHLLADYLRKLL